MPLVSRMLVHARGTRGTPRFLRGNASMRPASVSTLDLVLRHSFSELAVAHPELGLPFRRSEFADVLLDPRADQRGDFPPISPAAAVTLLGELMLLDRRLDPHAPGLAAYLALVGQRVHLAMARHLCAHREAASGPVLVEPTIDPGRWVSFDLRLDLLAVLLCDALRSTLLLDLERRLREPVAVRRTRLRETVIVDVLGCVRYRHELWRKLLRAQTCDERGGYHDHPGATVRPLAPLGSWHWLDGFLNRHRALLRQAVRAATGEPDLAGAWGSRLDAWLRGSVRAALRRSGAMPGLRRAIRASLPYSREQLELACRARRDPCTPLCGAEIEDLLCFEPAYRTLRRESRALLHLCAAVRRPDDLGRPNAPRRLKAMLRGMGLSRAGWRLLCRHGPRAYAAVSKGLKAADHIARAAVATLNLIAACQRPGLPPVELMGLLAEIEDQNLTNELLVPMPLLRAAWDAARALPTRHARRGFAAGAFARAVNWWRLHSDCPRVPAGCTWSWFEARTRAWEARERVRHAGEDAAWATLVPAFDHGGVRVVPLGSWVELWDEGLAMCHCTGSAYYAASCIKGTLRIYSLRDARSGRRLATAACHRKPGDAWSQGQVSGFANRPVTRADVIAACAELLHALNAAPGDDHAPGPTMDGDATAAA